MSYPGGGYPDDGYPGGGYPGGRPEISTCPYHRMPAIISLGCLMCYKERRQGQGSYPPQGGYDGGYGGGYDDGYDEDPYDDPYRRPRR